MEKEILSIRKLTKEDHIPFDLLLLADETEVAIKKYIYRSVIYVACRKNDYGPVGVIALNKINNERIEIKNIAVVKSLQHRGIGSFLLQQIKEIASMDNYREIIVGTPDSALKEIEFYEKNGFIRYGLRKNFFLRNYPNPIIENGIMLRDMVMLKMKILR